MSGKGVGEGVEHECALPFDKQVLGAQQHLGQHWQLDTVQWPCKRCSGSSIAIRVTSWFTPA